ncbi:g10267 [Coccomyxa elongata]
MSGEEVDDFEKAILITFAQNGLVDSNLKARALAYCDEVKASPSCLQLCLTRFASSPYIEVRFWCLQTLHEVLQKSSKAFEPQQLSLIKQTVWSWVRGAAQNALQPFLKNKIAQNAACIVQMDFQEQWQVLVGMLGEGSGAADMFCRILVAMDEDIISLEIPRSQDGVKASMELKDTMREQCLGELANIWYNLVVTYSESDPDLAEAVLSVVKRYVSWIDIGLVANDRFVPVLVALLSGASSGLAGAAADVLSEIVLKRMEPEAKLRLVQQLGLGPLIAAWADNLLRQESALEEVGLQCARLLAALVTEVLEAWKKVENSVVSFAAAGLAIDSEAAGEAGAACSTAQGLISALFPAVLATLSSEDDEVAACLVPFLQSYVAKLKNSLKRGALSQVHRQHIRGVLEAVAESAHYPESSAAEVLEGRDAAADPDALQAAEAEAAAAERRAELFVLFRNASKVAPEEGYAVTGTLLQRLVSQPSSEFRDSELAVSLLYELGEGASEEALKASSGALGQLALGLMQTDVPASGHRLVALALMETYVRYSRVLQQNTQYLPRVLDVFTGDKGIGHPDKAVGMRACYLFSRLVKGLRQNLLPLLPNLLVRLQPHLAHIVSTPLPDSTPTKSAQGLKGKGAPAAAAASDDRLYAFEAAGLLLGMEDLPAEEQREAVSALLRPLLAQLEEQLTVAGKAAAGSGERRQAEALVQQALEAVSRSSKGFSLQLCTQTRPAIGELLAPPLRAAILIPQVVPGNKVLRGRVISFLHRLVECLGDRLLPFLPAALAALLPVTADAADVSDVHALLSQLAMRYKAALQPLLAKVVPEVVGRVHALLAGDWDWSGADGKGGASEEARELADLQRSYYAFLSALAQNQLLQSLQGRSLEVALEALLRGAESHIDPATRKTCVQVMRRLVAELGGGQGPVGAQMRAFLMERCVGAVCLGGLARGGLDPRDAAVSALLTELAGLLLDCAARCDGELPAFLRARVLPQLQLGPALQEALLRDLEGGEKNTKQLKGHLKDIVHAASGVTPSSRGRIEMPDSNGMAARMSH